MSEDKKITKLDEYRAKKRIAEGIDIDFDDLIEEDLTNTKDNLVELINDENSLVHFQIKEKSIMLTFYDGRIQSDIEFYIDANGNIDTRLNKTRLK